MTTCKRRSKCFVPGCKTGYDADREKNKVEGVKNPSLFLVPKDVELKEMWNRAIPRADRNLEADDVICELHFAKEDILATWETKMPNGMTKIPN